MGHPPIRGLKVEDYRSLKDIHIKLGDVTVVLGPNGSGKSNLCQAFSLVKAAANGGLARRISFEGGLDQVVFAGHRSSSPSLKLTVEWTDAMYSFELGVRPISEGGVFPMDPQFKTETLKYGKVIVAERGKKVCRLRDSDGSRVTEVLPNDTESLFDQIGGQPIIDMMRRRIESWCFYHQFRVDPESPARLDQLLTFTSRLAVDGRDLIPALVTATFGANDDIEV
ncbi:MAG: AAA family ATPase, partial [Armatimonadota bacterium]